MNCNQYITKRIKGKKLFKGKSSEEIYEKLFRKEQSKKISKG